MRKNLLLLLLCGSASLCHAGPFSDELSRCLVRSATTEDQIILVRWMFAALASHPEVKDLAEVSAEKGEQMNKQAGQLFVELLTKRCHNESIQAVQYEGEKAIESSFNLLGQVAGQSLMTHPDVVEFMGGLARHVDQKAIEQAFGKK